MIQNFIIESDWHILRGVFIFLLLNFIQIIIASELVEKGIERELS